MSFILLVDDDVEVLELLKDFLEKHGYTVEVASDGPSLWQAIERDVPDLVILDVMLPGESGLTLCQKLRAKHKVGVIMLTAMSGLSDKVVGLELGADDYMSKPYDARELLARVRAVLRRTGKAAVSPDEFQCSVFEFAGWQLHLARRELRSPKGVMIPLSNGEFELLLIFVEHPQRVFSRMQLLHKALDEPCEALDRRVDVQVSRLRRKLDCGIDQEPIIRTIRGSGYIFNPCVLRK
ncbi:response regulator transcription factor [Pseudomonas syringae group genomosp. 3]|uniref:response regulator transcription factor n=1 Tax=Pseudomonas syringae group genomosp. 3 TaxID=251701 RepID=UPI000F001390|nr:response regulator transcription factor [Pseudomonas syringae group genomosp. 3]RMU40413.1 Chemotaxis protein CheY [Pseudomonas syringae pv. primulae]